MFGHIARPALAPHVNHPVEGEVVCTDMYLRGGGSSAVTVTVVICGSGVPDHGVVTLGRGTTHRLISTALNVRRSLPK